MAIPYWDAGHHQVCHPERSETESKDLRTDLADVLSDYPLTTVHQDFFARGYEACQRLLSLVQGGQSSSEHSFVAHRIVTRDTVRRIK